MTKLTFVS